MRNSAYWQLLISTSMLAGAPVAAKTLATSQTRTPQAGAGMTAPVADATVPSVSADAQAPVATQVAPQLAPASAADIGDIVVTANKRAQRINDVGLTITALSGSELAERRISSLSDIASAVPGLIYSQSTSNTPIFTLRGVGFNEAALGVYPAVSVYVDEAPLNFPVLASHSAYDLEQIEVLKGPQGTLFGQNSTGGAINYIAAKPTNVFTAGGDVSYGRFDDIQGNAYVSGPLSSNLSARLSINGENSNGWQKSYTRDDTLGDKRYIAGRLLLKWDASPGVRLQLNLNGWIDKSDPQALQYIALFPNDPSSVRPPLANAQFSPQRPRAADWSTGATRPFADRRFGQAALRADIDIVSDIKLTSLSSYDRFKQRQIVDGDGLALNIGDLVPDNGRLRSFNQELRIGNSASSAFRWLVGGNYESSRAVEHQRLFFPDDTNSSASTLFIYQVDNNTDQKIRNLAAFGNAEYDVIDHLTLKAGVRYTDSRRKANLCSSDVGDGRINALWTFLGNLLSGTAVPPLQQGQCISFDANFVPGRTPFIDTLHEHNVSWRVGADYKLSPDALLYANVSRGYKAGSYPTVSASTQLQLQPVMQEKVTAFESGFKISAADRRVQLNGAGFYYQYGDKQVRTKILDPIFGLLDTLANVPKSRIYGGEIEATVRPISGFSIGGGLTYLKSRVIKYTDINLISQVENFRGVNLPFTPRWTYTINADYRFERGSDHGTPFLGATVNGRSAEEAAFDGNRLAIPVSAVNKTAPGAEFPYHINGYATVDLRAGYEAPGGRWRVTVFGKNVGNKYYWNNVISTTDTVGRYAGEPATYGMALAFKM